MLKKGEGNYMYTKLHYTSLLSALVLLILVSPLIQVSANSLQSLNYYVIYDPVEDSGLIVVNATVSITDCELMAIPIAIIGEDAEFSFLNYTVEGDLLVDGVDYNETGYLELLGCGDGAISLLLSAKNIFEEQGVLSYSTIIDTSQLEELSTQVKVVVKVTGYYSVIHEQAGNVEVYVDESEGIIEITGYGMVFLTLHAAFEETSPITPPTLSKPPSTVTPPTATSPPRTTPPTTEVAKSPETAGFSESLSNPLIIGGLVAVIIAIAIVLLIKKRSGVKL